MHVVVFSTNEVKSNMGETRDEHRQVPRNSKHGDRVCHLETVWRRAHTEVLHVGISSQDLTQKTQRKWRVNKEMEGWEMRVGPELLPLDDDGDECSDE